MKTIKSFIQTQSNNFKTTNNDKVIFEGDRDFIMNCHGTDMLPDDFRYKTLRSIFIKLSDLLDYSNIEDFEDFTQKHSYEIIDSCVDIYNSDLLKWYSSNNRLDYMEQAKDEGLISENMSELERIQVGQYMEITELFNNVTSTILEFCED